MELIKPKQGLNLKFGVQVIGFGSYHYKYSNGHEGDAPLTGFSPRKDAIALYLAREYEGKEVLLQKLGKHKAAKACIYIKKLDDVNENVLKEMIDASMEHLKALYSGSD